MQVSGGSSSKDRPDRGRLMQSASISIGVEGPSSLQEAISIAVRIHLRLFAVIMHHFALAFLANHLIAIPVDRVLRQMARLPSSSRAM